jgi:multimeric flavodoxin WrbA
MKIAVILGTSRLDGNTHKLVNAFAEVCPSEVYNLKNFDMSSFDYEHKNINDDFLALIQKLNSFEHWIFATPVYWYSMSSQMKVFFDRLSDLLTVQKDQGRILRGKSCSLITTGSDKTLSAGFEQPFILTANYLGLDYKGGKYFQCSPDFEKNQALAELHNYVSQIVK